MSTGDDRNRTLQEVINRAVELGMRELHTCIPAKVVKWDASKQRANCQILVKNVTEGEEGDRQVHSWPVVPGVPVQFLGAGGFRITCPISDGTGGNASTTGSLIFSHRSLDKWLTGTGGEVDPEFDHDHALADAVFFPGLMPFGAPWQSCPTDTMSIGSDSDGNGRIHFKASEIQLGEGATKKVARDGDPTDQGFLTVAFNPGTGGATLSITKSSGDPPPGPPPPMTSYIDLDGVINGGSDHIKAVD